jgi:hypothetical protein
MAIEVGGKVIVTTSIKKREITVSTLDESLPPRHLQEFNWGDTQSTCDLAGKTNKRGG